MEVGSTDNTEQESLEAMIAEHSSGAPAPEVQEAKIIEPELTPEEKKKEASNTRSEFKKHFLGDGFLSGMMLNIFITVFAYGNAMIYNLVFRNKRHVEWQDLKPAPKSEDEEEINDLLDLYAPKVMEFLDALPDEVLMLAFIEYGFITRLSIVSKEIKHEDKEESEEFEKKEKVINLPFFVVTRDKSPKYWRDDNSWTDNLAAAYAFTTEESAEQAKGVNETVTKWVKK